MLKTKEEKARSCSSRLWRWICSKLRKSGRRLDCFFLLSNTDLELKPKNKKKIFELILSPRTASSGVTPRETLSDTIEAQTLNSEPPQMINTMGEFELIDTSDRAGTEDKENERDEIQEKETNTFGTHVGPTIIYCLPNAGLYETTALDSQWVNFYLDMGFNVFLWNYRGYGYSQGSPSPENLQQDALTVYDYMKQKLKISQIAVHGQSIGCIPAIHLAKNRVVDYLLADRGFCSLPRVIQGTLPPFLIPFYNLLNNWTTETVQSYLGITKTPKLLIHDPRDSVIGLTGSIASGITSHFYSAEILNKKAKTQAQNTMNSKTGVISPLFLYPGDLVRLNKFLGLVIPEINEKTLKMVAAAGRRLFTLATNLSSIRAKTPRRKTPSLKDFQKETNKPQVPANLERRPSDPENSKVDLVVDDNDLVQAVDSHLNDPNVKMLLSAKYSYKDELPLLDPLVKPIVSDLLKVLSNIEGGGLSLHAIVTDFSAEKELVSLKVTSGSALLSASFKWS